MILCFRKLDPNYNPSQKTTKPQQTDALLTNVNKKLLNLHLSNWTTEHLSMWNQQQHSSLVHPPKNIGPDYWGAATWRIPPRRSLGTAASPPGEPQREQRQTTGWGGGGDLYPQSATVVPLLDDSQGQRVSAPRGGSRASKAAGRPQQPGLFFSIGGLLRVEFQLRP